METNSTVMHDDGGWLFRLSVHLGLLFVCTAFMAMLFAPMFADMFEKPMIRKYAIYPNCESLVKQEMAPIKFTLWVMCGLAWAVLIALNV
jgi:hypothetical protein